MKQTVFSTAWAGMAGWAAWLGLANWDGLAWVNGGLNWMLEIFLGFRAGIMFLYILVYLCPCENLFAIL